MFTRLKNPTANGATLSPIKANETMKANQIQNNILLYDYALPRTSSNCSLPDQVFDDGFPCDSSSEISFQINLNDNYHETLDESASHCCMTTTRCHGSQTQDEIIFAAVEYIEYLHEQLETTDSFYKSRKDGHPKRPKNGFIRFSVEHRKLICKDSPKMDNRQVSKILGAMWKNMSEMQRRPYEQQFEEEINGIREHVPNWKYAPVRPMKTGQFEPMPSRLRPREQLRRKVPKMTRGYRKRGTEPFCDTKSKYPRRTDVSRKTDVEPLVNWVQCDVCFKWRRLPVLFNPQNLPEVWICSMNRDPRYQSCMVEEEDAIKIERKLEETMNLS